MKETNNKVDRIPVIDVAILNQLTPDEVNAENPKVVDVAKQFGKALHETGFLYLENHGVSPQVISNAFTRSKSFFNLPDESKLKYLKCKETASTNFNGYISPGHEVLKKDGLTEGIKVEKKEAYDLSQTENRKFPTNEAPEFQRCLEDMEEACKQLDIKLLKILALSIGLQDIDFFLNKHTHLSDSAVLTRSVFRTLYYPPVPISSDEDSTKPCFVGCNEHTDWDVLTLLFQDSISGLEVKTLDGRWIRATPINNTIIVNTGDMLEAWTRGYFRATPHRVRVMQTQDHEEARKAFELQNDTGEIAETNHSDAQSAGRQSIAYFVFPDDGVLISSLETDLVEHCGDRIMEPFYSYDYFAHKAAEANANY